MRHARASAHVRLFRSRRPVLSGRYQRLVGHRFAIGDTASAYFDTMTLAIVASVGMPPSIRRGLAGACTMPASQERHAYLGRRVTRTRNCAGTISSRSLTSSPPLIDCFAINCRATDDVALSTAATGHVWFNHFLNAWKVLRQDATPFG